MNSRIGFIGAFLLALGVPRLSWAFPEMVRHGYPNCTSCHVSPNGGGVLTPYGRQLSAAALSTWGTDNETASKFAFGVVPLPDFVDAMGLFRGVYAYQNTPYVQQGEYIFMQNDIEADVHSAHWYLDAAVGYQNPPIVTSWTDHLISRRHYIDYRPTEQWSFRFGRFYPAYGILTPDHVIPTRAGLGWDQDMETYNLEAAYLGDQWNLFVTGIFGRPDNPSLQTGFALTPSISIADHYKIGVSYNYGVFPNSRRNLFGPWGILGFTEHFFLLTEWDFDRQENTSGPSNPTWGAVNYQRLDYEVIQGLHFYLTQDYSRLNFKDTSTLQNSFGIGSQFFPYSHFEINLSWQKLRNLLISTQYTDFAWIMFNFYL